MRSRPLGGFVVFVVVAVAFYCSDYVFYNFLTASPSFSPFAEVATGYTFRIVLFLYFLVLAFIASVLPLAVAAYSLQRMALAITVRYPFVAAFAISVIV